MFIDNIFSDDRDEFGYCIVCLDRFPKKALNSRDECEEHNGETLLSDEEREDWDSFIENIRK
ncbi:MAG: hypothetical protein KKE62_06000 [Proteobacteria bacterium]|nr:hypothetical protein [Pseudomonadota bacterium]MBU1542380.1 hypothetical protein [Pseudomonadota bacterium]MBU2430818.1 hypothetical protein [Pseudomonadota bacterium]